MPLKDRLERLLGRGDLHPLPGSFLLGVATADHQCEAYDPDYIDIRDVWERATNPNAARKAATDFWNRYEEDIDLAYGLGCNAFRFSIAWSRVEPRPGQFNDDALDHYQRLIKKITSCGMLPLLTLHHFTWPVHVERQGGIIGDNFPAAFARYAAKIAEHFSQEVPYWITFNEPNLLVGGYLKPWWDANYAAPPGMPQGTTTQEQVLAVGKLIRNLFLSHKAAYTAIKAENPRAMVGVNQYFYGLPGWLQQLINGNAQSIKGYDDLLRQSERLSLPPSFFRWSSWTAKLASLLNQNKADVVVAALTRTRQRERQVMFSEAYFTAHQQLLVREDDGVRGIEGLAKKTVAVARGSVSMDDLTEIVPDAKADVVSDYFAALKSLDHGVADALLADNTILYGLMARYPGCYRLIDELPSGNEPYATAVAQGDGDLLDLLDTVVREFNRSEQSATWRAKYERITGHKIQMPHRTIRTLPISQPSIMANARAKESSNKLTSPMPNAPEGSSIRRIQDRGYLIAAVRDDLPGFAYRDSNTGELKGLEIELVQALAMRIFDDFSKVRFQVVTTEDRIPQLLPKISFLDSLLKQYSIMTTILMANWWYMGMAGLLDEYLCPADCSGKLDFVGLDYYWGISTLHLERIQRLIDAAYRHFDRAPVCPGTLYGILKDLRGLFPDKPLIIFENGSVTVADGVDRATYIQKHIREVQRAVQDGINVKGYVCWAITSNREWDCEFCDASDFGLFHIDLDGDPSLKRNPTAAADIYRQIIQNKMA